MFSAYCTRSEKNAHHVVLQCWVDAAKIDLRMSMAPVGAL